MAALEELDAATPDVPDVAAATVAQAATVAPSAGGELDPELDADFHADPAYTTSKQFEVSNLSSAQVSPFSLLNMFRNKFLFVCVRLEFLKFCLLGLFRKPQRKREEMGLKP